MNTNSGTKSSRFVLAAAAVVTAAAALASAGCAAVGGGSSAAGTGATVPAAGGSSPSALQLPPGTDAGTDTAAGGAGAGSTGMPAEGTQTTSPAQDGQTLPPATVPATPLPTSSSSFLDGQIHLPPGVLTPIVTVTPGPSGTIGYPNVPCLNGFVWRKAYPGDYVCVTTTTEAQTKADNVAASSRVNPDGGPYGAATCLQGYVWRQVVTNDDVCVTPAVRSAAAADNAVAGKRIAALNLWATEYTPAQSGDTETCSGDVCSVTEGGWDGPDVQLNGDQFNNGQVTVEIKSTGGKLLWASKLYTGTQSGYPDYVLAVQTSLPDCTPVTASTETGYAIAYDEASGRWSNKVWLDTGCKSL